MSSKHTPGPWILANGNEVHDQEIRFDSDRSRIGNTPNMICRVEYPYTDHEGQEANARLIAAAPEMLAELRAVLNMLGNMTTTDYSIGSDKPVRDRISNLLSRINGDT